MNGNRLQKSLLLVRTPMCRSSMPSRGRGWITQPKPVLRRVDPDLVSEFATSLWAAVLQRPTGVRRLTAGAMLLCCCLVLGWGGLVLHWVGCSVALRCASSCNRSRAAHPPFVAHESVSRESKRVGACECKEGYKVYQRLFLRQPGVGNKSRTSRALPETCKIAL